MPGRPFSYLGKRVRELQINEWFVCRTEDVKEAARAAAKYAGIKIETRKIEDGWAVKRIA